jgi:hypothetical protein
MQLEPFDPALQAANLALLGRRFDRSSGRLASVQLRSLDHDPRQSATRERKHLAWEAVATLIVGVAALLGVVGLWFL